MFCTAEGERLYGPDGESVVDSVFAGQGVR